jgi:two-component system chemotaxis sensor kinase CheA
MGDDLLRELLATFAVEAREHLQAMGGHLLELEKSSKPSERERLLSEVFRAAHSLKGAARAVGAEAVETLAHRLETFFVLVQGGEVDPDPAAYDVVHRTLDAMRALVGETTAGEAAEVDVAALSSDLEAVGQRGPGKARPPSGPAGARRGNGSKGRKAAGASRRGSPKKGEGDGPLTGEGKLSEETVRVSTVKLDSLMAQVGELLVARAGMERHDAELRQLFQDLAAWEAAWRQARPRYRSLLASAHEGSPVVETPDATALLRQILPFLEENEARLRAIRERLGGVRGTREAGRRMAQLTVDLQEDVRRIRMFPTSTLFEAFPRMVRDLAREQGKEIDLVVRGGDTEVDRSVLEQIRAPLTHLLRNCVDHAIERPEARLEAGKPRGGTITLTASQRGGRLLIEVADDGAGIDPATVRAAAVERGFLAPDAALGDREVLGLIFRSGLSTSPIVTDLSGRGIGLDVVRESVERLQGIVEVDSRPGAGTTFTLTLPLAVAATRCLLVRAADQTYALPVSSVVRILRLGSHEVGRAEGMEAAELEGEPVVLVGLSDVLQLETPERPAHPEPTRLAVVLGSAERRVGFLVDALVGEQDAVIKGLPRPLTRVVGTAGATILGTGEVVMVLSVADLMRLADRAGTRRTAGPEPVAQIEAVPPTIVVADDSITTRTLERNILEAAGYRVRIAVDGAEAWKLLKKGDVDLLVSDVLMPGVDGFELTARIRADKRLKDLPVILVTSLESGDHRERGIEVGADAYIVKSAFDQDRLLETIRRLM